MVLRKVQNRGELEQHLYNISRYLPYTNRDVKLSVLSLGHFISFSMFSFATEEVKGVNFPSRANDQFEKRCYRYTVCKFSEIPLFILTTSVKLVNKCTNKHKAQKKLSKGSNVYD